MSDLHEAAKAGDAGAVREILARDPYRVSDRRDGKLTALHLAAAAGHAAVIEQLLGAGASPGARDQQGATPLHRAAGHGHAVVVAALLARGARPSPVNEAGETPLHEAARAGHVEAAAALLDHGANPNARGQCGGSPLEAAALAGQRQAAELLLSRGALANARSSAHAEAYTPWRAAQDAGHAELAELLLRHGGPDPGTGPIDIHRCAERGYDGRLELLLDQDPAQVSKLDYLHRRTVLHWAAAAGRGSIAERLLARGADPAASDKHGKTPADLAEQAGFLELASRLRGVA